VIEMVLHTAAVVDHANLVAGRATPVLTTHLSLAAVAYPVFGVVFIGFVVATGRDRTTGSPWIAWIGVLGAVAWGLSAPLVIVFRIEQAGVLFPMLMLVAFWLVLAAVWPLRAVARARIAEAT
jgi:hypothetical protein